MLRALLVQRSWNVDNVQYYDSAPNSVDTFNMLLKSLTNSSLHAAAVAWSTLYYNASWSISKRLRKQIKTSCARGDTICPRPSPPPSRAAEQTQRSSTFPRRLLQPPYALTQRRVKRTGDLDLESGVRVTCDVIYLCANFGLPRPLCSRLRPDVRDRHTSDKSIA